MEFGPPENDVIEHNEFTDKQTNNISWAHVRRK